MRIENPRRYLIGAGILLFLIALIFGLIFPRLANPRMGLSAHLIGLQGGVFLAVLGLIWSELNLSPSLAKATIWLGLYGCYGNFVTNVIAAAYATNRLQPIFGSGKFAGDVPENIVSFGLITIAAAIAACCVLVLWGLRRKVAV
ncbi:MAG: hydrogenase [Pyrinomonadaceae bacterium]|nr:hydrogenase [Pyrinomonadaceae bacterium]